ncbi:MAG: hypothetical protein ACLSHG_12925 [Oscillospiraceae bacterium]
MKKRTNPLTRRIPRELAGDWRKYLVVFLFLVLTICFVSGMYVANESMMRASVDGVTTYKLEYGHFEAQPRRGRYAARRDRDRRQSGRPAVLHRQGAPGARRKIPWGIPQPVRQRIPHEV